MATTKSRKLRRQQLHRQHEQIEVFIKGYELNPREALRVAFETYGRERFERILRQYISQHTIKSALTFTLKRVLQKEAA